jgi:methylenetetrahydrofolate reductase (NADPH)
MSTSLNNGEQLTADACRKPTLRHLLEETNRFLVAVELVTSRGVISDFSGQRVLDHALALGESPRIDVFSITDNPAGNAMLAPDTLGAELRAHGQEVVIHLACKDGNRNYLQSRGWKLSSEGFDNILALTGDYPKAGYGGMARPSFDIDSVGLLSMYADMNRGLLDETTGRAMKPTNFFLGAAVTTHKRYERELLPQYLKLRRKINNGARFVINQAGYDARKDDELVRWLALYGLDVPVIANVFVLSLGAARAFNAGRVPGVVVSDDLLARCESHASSPDRGRSFFLDLAAKQVAVARGLGFRGAYLGGRLRVADCEEILSQADEFARSWKTFAGEVSFSCPNEFYYFEPGDMPGLSSSEVNRALVASLSKVARRRSRMRTHFGYRASRLTHSTVFDPKAPLFDLGRRFYTRIGSAPASVQKLLRVAEHVSKMPLYNCQNCGDCSLAEIAYLCPESQCEKNQRNGPCGGSHDGQCEFADRECIWARAYERLKPYGEEGSMLDGPVVFNDYALRRTSAWANTFLRCDHLSRPQQQREDAK